MNRVNTLDRRAYLLKVQRERLFESYMNCEKYEESLYENALEGNQMLINSIDKSIAELHLIHHEDLASISQQSWYQSCYQTNSAIRLEDATYRVICLKHGDQDEVSFDCLEKLNEWASY